MRTRTAVLLALAVVLLGLGLNLPAIAADKGAPEDPANSPKVFIIYTDGPGTVSGGGVVLTGLHREDFHGIPCLVGRGVDGWVPALKGRTIRVPCAKIVTVMEFENLDAWKKFGDTKD